MSQETTQLSEPEAVACEAKPQPNLPQVTPRYQIEQQEEGYQVIVELPGVAKGDAQLKLEKRLLSLQAQRRFELPESARVHSQGIGNCRYDLRLKLGEDIDAQGLSASLEDGLLRLDLPLASEAQSREIAVN